MHGRLRDVNQGDLLGTRRVFNAREGTKSPPSRSQSVRSGEETGQCPRSQGTQESGSEMAIRDERQPGVVPEGAKQAGDTLSRDWDWVERSVWTDRMLAALERGVWFSFTIQKGEIFGIVCESGCGKSTLAKTILGIYRASEGEVYLNGEKIKAIREKIQYVYQDQGASLDPWWRVRKTLREPLLIHQQLSSAEMNEKVKSILKEVGLILLRHMVILRSVATKNINMMSRKHWDSLIPTVVQIDREQKNVGVVLIGEHLRSPKLEIS
jgi:hypothetical protein